MTGGSSTDWDRLRRRVYRRDDWQCQCCGRRGNEGGNAQLHSHHVVARSDGGADQLANLVTLCDRCHATYHDNPDLLADRSSTLPSVLTKPIRWILTNAFDRGATDPKTVEQALPRESNRRVAEREAGLEALEQLQRKLSASDDATAELDWSGEESPPIHYTTRRHLLVRSGDDVLNERFSGCPDCGQSALTADWLNWTDRGSAKRIQCDSCDALYEERIVHRNGRALLDLEPIQSVFDVETVSSPVRYHWNRPELAVPAFDARYGTDCPACGGMQTLQYERGWRRADLFPRKRWTCHDCTATFIEGEEQYRRVDSRTTDLEAASSGLWYYTIGPLALLAVILLLVDVRFVAVSGLLLAPSVYKDAQFVRSRSNHPLSTRFWVWATVVVSVVGATGYLLNRKRVAVGDSDHYTDDSEYR